MCKYQLRDVIESSEIVVRSGRFAYLKCKERPSGNHFLVAQDSDEVTVVIEESRVPEVAYSDSTRWFRLLEVRVSLPFLAKGFLAMIAQTVADQDLNILLVSTYSKDYALVREESAEVAIAALKNVGFPVHMG